MGGDWRRRLRHNRGLSRTLVRLDRPLLAQLLGQQFPSDARTFRLVIGQCIPPGHGPDQLENLGGVLRLLDLTPFAFGTPLLSHYSCSTGRSNIPFVITIAYI